MKRSLSLAGLAVLLAGLAAPHHAAANDVADQIQFGAYGIETGMFNVLFAKELCSCLYVDNLSMDECIARDNLPSAVHKAVKLTPSDADKSLKSEFVGVETLRAMLALAGLPVDVTPGPSATARYVNERLGCVLTTVGTQPPESLGGQLGDLVANQIYPNGPTPPLSTPDDKVSCCYICQQEYRTKTVLGHTAPGNVACGENVCQRVVRLQEDCRNYDGAWIAVAGDGCKAQGAKDGYTFYRYSAASYGGFLPRDQCRGADGF